MPAKAKISVVAGVAITLKDQIYYASHRNTAFA